MIGCVGALSLALLGGAGAAAARTIASAPANAPAGAPAPQLTTNTNAPCNTPQPKGLAHCLAVVRTPSDHQITPDASGPPATALGPADIRSAYNLPTGGGQTVAIVDAGDDPSAESDLAVFRSQYGLAPCTTANGCFRKVNQEGRQGSYPPDVGWDLEISLDLDAVSSACPGCKILLVEANSPNNDDLGATVDEAVTLGAKFISNSYGEGEFLGEQSQDHFFNHPGVAVAFASGDFGDVVSYPASVPNVVSVGGTRLTRDATVPRGWTERAWGAASTGAGGGGSGCSFFEPHPDYQNGITTNCPDNRATADVSADADPASGLAVFDSRGGDWLQVGGTSLAAPLLTSMYALAGTPATNTNPVTYPYRDQNQSSDLFDITTGSNGNCGNLLCQAGPAWDGPTGLGTPNGVKALQAAPQGLITGRITDAATGAAIAGAEVTARPGGYGTVTDTNGEYVLNIAAGSYDLSADAFGYKAATQTGVQVVQGQTANADLALTTAPTITLSGTVLDGSGHGWPLSAKISIPGDPVTPVYTDPFSGHYSIQVPGLTSYTVQVDAVYPPVLQPANAGYTTQQVQVDVGGGDTTRDFTLPVDTTSCTAAGYGWKGATETFTGWTGHTTQDGWTVTNAGRAGQTWSFDNPGNRPAPGTPAPKGDNEFAVVDSDQYGPHGSQDTSLVSPIVDLSGPSTPQLSFDTGYYTPGHGQTASVDLSINGGRTWTTVWRPTPSDGVGRVEVPIPQAAGRSAVRVRFHFIADDGWYWAVDNVFIRTHDCVPMPGGAVAGLVTDHATGLPLDGAHVTSPDSAAASGFSTTSDPNLPSGFYWLFAPLTGSHPFTATAAGYDPVTATVHVAADTVTRQDWSLTPGGG